MAAAATQVASAEPSRHLGGFSWHPDVSSCYIQLASAGIQMASAATQVASAAAQMALPAIARWLSWGAMAIYWLFAICERICGCAYALLG